MRKNCKGEVSSPPIHQLKHQPVHIAALAHLLAVEGAVALFEFGGDGDEAALEFGARSERSGSSAMVRPTDMAAILRAMSVMISPCTRSCLATVVTPNHR